MNATKARELLDYSWWFIPAVLTATSVLLAVGMVLLDEGVSEPPGLLAFSGNADAARTVLGTMNGSVLTFTALTFSITVVVLVLTSGQFSPRVLRTFLHDRPTQLALGLFVGTYVYILIVLREVRGTGANTFVPRMSVTGAFLLTAVAILVFVYFVHHIAHSVRAATIINRIADETRTTLLRLYPERGPGDQVSGVPVTVEALGTADVDRTALPDAAKRLLQREPEAVIRTTSAGVVTAIEADRLLEEAIRADRVLVLVPKLGDFLRTGAPMVRVYRPKGVGSGGGGSSGVDAGRVRRAVTLQQERSTRADVAFGVRQLVDIAERAQSPGVNDPTTSIQCLHLIHDLLWHLAVRPMPSGVYADSDGTLRLLRPVWTWADFVHLGFDELHHWGADSLQLHREARHVLLDLLDTVGDGERRRPLEEQWRLLDARLGVDLPESEHVAALRGAPEPPGSVRRADG